MPIVSTLTDAYESWHTSLPHLPRLSRFTLGAKIDDIFTDAIELILLAGYAPREKKLTILERAIGKIDLLKFFLQLAWKLKILDNRKYLAIARPVREAGKQLGGWRRQLTRSAPNT